MIKLILFCFVLIVSSCSRHLETQVVNDVKVTEVKINFVSLPPIESGQSAWSVITPEIKIKASNRRPPPVYERGREFCKKNTQRYFSNNARLLQKSDKNLIRKIIFSWMKSPPLGSDYTFLDESNKSKEMQGTKQLKCELKIFDYSNPTEDLINSDQSLDVIYPGSLVQGYTIDSGSSTLQKLPISQQYRFPIRIGGRGNFVPMWSESSQAADVHRTIKQAIWESQGFQSSDVFYKLYTSQETSSLLTTFKLNAKIVKILDISAGFTGEWTTRKSKFFVTLLQGFADFFADKYVLDGSLINDAVGVFLKENFCLQELQAIEEAGYWGRENIPCYVNQVTYGRLMIISIDQNERTRKLFAELNAGISGIGSFSAAMKMTQMFQDSSTKVFSVGPFDSVETNDLKSGSWTRFFEPIPANSPKMDALKPIGFRVQDFRGRNVKVSNRLQYDRIVCQTKPAKRVEIKLFDVWKQAGISIKKTGQTDFVKWRQVEEGTHTFDISSELTSGDNDRIRISNVGGRRNAFLGIGAFSRKVTLVIIIDGVNVYDDRSQCEFCHSQDAFQCVINKYTGKFNCQKF